ncbi:MAG TPA: GNAT family protein [Pseudomonas sp.]|nr:GNAT family protein [Pseudomonas sp.]
MLIYGQDDVLLPWAAQKIGIERFRDDARAIGQSRNGVINAVVVFDAFTACDMNMHVASDGTGHWLTRELLVHAFAYPFITCKRRRVTLLIASRNTKSLRFASHLGFRYEGYFRHAMPDDDIVALGMLREHCRYIPKEFR